MATDHHDNQKPFSLLQTNDQFVNKILSRDSSFGCSSRCSYYRNPGKTPFKWETQPGKPKNFPNERYHQPIISSPPVTDQKSMVVYNPNSCSSVPHKKRVWFWKRRSKKNDKTKKSQLVQTRKSDGNVLSQLFDGNHGCSSDLNKGFSSFPTVLGSYNSSASLSSSSSNVVNRPRVSKLKALLKVF